MIIQFLRGTFLVCLVVAYVSAQEIVDPVTTITSNKNTDSTVLAVADSTPTPAPVAVVLLESTSVLADTTVPPAAAVETPSEVPASVKAEETIAVVEAATTAVVEAALPETTTIYDETASTFPERPTTQFFGPTYNVFFVTNSTTTTTTTTSTTTTTPAPAPVFMADVQSATMAPSEPSSDLMTTLTSLPIGFGFGVTEPSAAEYTTQPMEPAASEPVVSLGSANYTITETEPETKSSAGGGDFLSGLFGGGGGGGGLFGGGGGGGEADEGNLKCYTCESCPQSTDLMRKETCVDFSALCVTKIQYTMRRGKLFHVRKSRFCGPSQCPPSSLMSRFSCCSGDLCNDASSSRFNGFNLKFAVAIALIAALINF